MVLSTGKVRVTQNPYLIGSNQKIPPYHVLKKSL